MTNNVTKNGLSILILFLLFTPQFIILGVILKTIYLIFFAIGFYEIVKNGINIKLIPLLVTISISIIFLLLNKIYYQNYDIFPLDQLLIAPFIIFSTSFLIRQYIRLYKEEWLRKIVDDLLFALIINSTIIYLSVVSDDIKNLLYSLIHVTEKAERYLFGNQVHNLRFPGITVSGFSYLSTIYSFILIINSTFYIVNRVNCNYPILLFKFLYVTISLIFVARTGLYISILAILPIIILIFTRSSINNKLLIFLIAFSTIIFFNIYYNYIENFLKFAFEIFINLYSGEGLTSETTDTLINDQLFFDTANLLFGSGNFGRGSEYIDSDIGWVLFYSGAGAIGTILIYLPILYILFFSIYISYNIFYKYTIISMTILLMLLNFKDIYYLSHGYIQPLLIIFISYLYRNKLK